MSSTELRGLFSSVQRHHGLGYLLISRLNQDRVNSFSQVSVLEVSVLSCFPVRV